MDPKELGDLTVRALAAAVDGDTDLAALTVCEIGQKSSPDQHELYAACSAFAEAARQALVQLYAGRAPDPARGQFWTVRHMPSRPSLDAADMFAMRFVTAYANDDKPNALALWRAALLASHEEYVSSVASVLSLATSLVQEMQK